MSENVQADPAPATDATAVAQAPCESPPPAAQPPREADPSAEPRARLLQLAAQLMRSHNRRLVVEYLRLRRAV
jgi:hypothetical protein